MHCSCVDLLGTQDASNIWQDDYSELFASAGWKQGRASAATFYREADDARALAHGDDFMILGDQQTLEDVDIMLKSRYECKQTARLGPEAGDDLEAVFLNRALRYILGVRPEMEIEADARHADLVVAELGLQNAKPVTTPSVKPTAEQVAAEAKLPILSASEVTQYRSVTMRAAYLAQDRPDIQEAAKRRARKMQGPTSADVGHMRRIVRARSAKGCL